MKRTLHLSLFLLTICRVAFALPYAIDLNSGEIAPVFGVGSDVTCTNCVSLGTETTGNYVADITAGNYLDVADGGAEGATITVSLDPTEIGTWTLGAAAASYVWTWDLAGTDLSLTFGSNLFTFGNPVSFSSAGSGTITLGSAGVSMTEDGDGAITFLGLGNGSDEDLTLNLDDTSNTATFTSSTGLNVANFSSISLQESGVNVPTTIDICKTIESPVDADVFLMHRASKAMTISSTNCIVEAATSAVLTWQECDSAGDNCSTIESMTCDVDGAADNGVDNASIDSGDWIRLDVGTVSGTPGHGTACLTAVDA